MDFLRSKNRLQKHRFLLPGTSTLRVDQARSSFPGIIRVRPWLGVGRRSGLYRVLSPYITRTQDYAWRLQKVDSEAHCMIFCDKRLTVHSTGLLKVKQTTNTTFTHAPLALQTRRKPQHVLARMMAKRTLVVSTTSVNIIQANLVLKNYIWKLWHL